MRNTTIGIVAILVVVFIGGYMFLGSAKANGNSITGDVTNNGEVQKIVISEKDLNYYPQIIKVKANQQVSISLDEKVKGCLRSFTIKEFELVKYLKTPSDTLDFTPTQKGTFVFSCSMGMGYGKLVVE
ncbi:MAG: cupredoxin domain-containing protein [Nanoarchaeota archaeon]